MESSSGLTDTSAAIFAGVLAGLIMIVPMYMGLIMMPRHMKMDLLKLMGTVMMPVSSITYPVGLMLHLVMSIVFALIHVVLYDAFNIETSLAAWGILFGLGHALISGIGFGTMPLMHRGIKDGVVEAPGFMALSYPSVTTSGFVMVHVLFGVLVGAFFEAFN
jgi:hypothetical protein